MGLIQERTHVTHRGAIHVLEHVNTSSSPKIESPVETLVVGAGPTGLAAACELRRRGHQVAIVDAGAEGSNTSRAAVIHARTLEVLEPLQLTRRLTAEGVVVPKFTMRDRDRVLARIDFSHLPTKYPYTVMLPQYRTEQLLAERLTELGGTVYRQLRLTGLTQDDGQAVAELTRPDGSRTRVNCRYLIGADGLHSAVRDLTGIPFKGKNYPQVFVLADATIDWPLPPAEVQLFFSPAGLLVVAPLPHGHHRIVATVDLAPEHPGLGGRRCWTAAAQATRTSGAWSGHPASGCSTGLPPTTGPAPPFSSATPPVSTPPPAGRV